jgi:hypothetical protein
MTRVTYLVFAILIFALAGLMEWNLIPHEGGAESIVSELSYFPSGKLLHFVSMGFRDILTDWIWIRFVQYYGEQRLTSKDYSYVGHILKILTDLDSRFIHAYTFGAIILITDAKEEEKGYALLNKGMMDNPADWHIPFMAGFSRYVFSKDHTDALTYFKLSSHKPNAPEMPRRFAAFISKKRGYLDVALRLWYELLETTENEYERQTALYSIKNVHILVLQKKIEEFFAHEGRYPENLDELVRYGYLPFIPIAPDEGKYYIDWEQKAIYCTTEGCEPGAIGD